ncbi:hypothetical protein NLX83_33865 [Allokutzneria sp. A3M-2-11 16]|uniref:hypothetical protein n=1 Tax=Allokutzneria sp. A3M-2-11 16 TaxID=2962043 RepID=UPI0020B7C475|nr:hypothetical protein [Allokutzneria sp. A3M-2-11 16]MCP3804269.1 hypothetical protein [Allokutzneria sp. A3M-2-11 16]
MSAVPQIVTLAGVLVGGLMSFAATTLVERSKWRRTHSSRWDEKRLTAYIEYANAVKTCSQLSYRLAATHGHPAGAQPIELEEGLKALAEAEIERTVKWEAVLLLGSPEAVAAGRSWHEAIWKLSWVARGQAIGRDEFIGIYEISGRRRDEFYRCARADLGVRSGDLPKPTRDWLPPADKEVSS